MAQHQQGITESPNFVAPQPKWHQRLALKLAGFSLGMLNGSASEIMETLVTRVGGFAERNKDAAYNGKPSKEYVHNGARPKVRLANGGKTLVKMGYRRSSDFTAHTGAYLDTAVQYTVDGRYREAGEGGGQLTWALCA